MAFDDPGWDVQIAVWSILIVGLMGALIASHQWFWIASIILVATGAVGVLLANGIRIVSFLESTFRRSSDE